MEPIRRSNRPCCSNPPAIPLSARARGSRPGWRRLWRRLLRETAGNAEAARQRLDLIEARMLMRDTARIWGFAPPAARTCPPVAESALPRR
ncbi:MULTISPECIES: DUF6525 family protein [Paracoccus]|uniref:DUF6525 family protein n=1 Tax=Paracoccus TaxID=265 RepID=UPI001F0620D9|nr:MULTISPECIES: DUF6525 family protein [Paracoccus]